MTAGIGKSGSKALLAADRQLARTEVLVGFPTGEASREDGSKHTIAAVAYIQTTVRRKPASQPARSRDLGLQRSRNRSPPPEARLAGRRSPVTVPASRLG